VVEIDDYERARAGPGQGGRGRAASWFWRWLPREARPKRAHPEWKAKASRKAAGRRPDAGSERNQTGAAQAASRQPRRALRDGVQGRGPELILDRAQ
jgi:hypothetical protein